MTLLSVNVCHNATLTQIKLIVYLIVHFMSNQHRHTGFVWTRAPSGISLVWLVHMNVLKHAQLDLIMIIHSICVELHVNNTIQRCYSVFLTVMVFVILIQLDNSSVVLKHVQTVIAQVRDRLVSHGKVLRLGGTMLLSQSYSHVQLLLLSHLVL